MNAPVEQRRDACRMLACELGDPRVDILLAVLRRDQPAALRVEAAYCLGGILRDVRAFEPFCAIIRDRGEEPELRGFVTELVSNFAGVDAVPILIAALDDREPMVRFDAAWSLNNVGDERARDALEAHVDDADNPYDHDHTTGEVARHALERLGPRKRTAPRKSPRRRSGKRG